MSRVRFISLDIRSAIGNCGRALSLDVAKPLRPEAILLVDDDDLYVRGTTRLLRGLGFPYVFRASSAGDALEMLERVRPSIVLSDMVMEHRNAGREVVAACLAKAIRVAVISGLPGLEEAELGCRLVRKASLSGQALSCLITELLAEPVAPVRSYSTALSAQRAG